MTTIPAPLNEEEIAEIRNRFERNYTNIVLGAELSLDGQTRAVSDIGHLLKALEHLQSEIARKDEALENGALYIDGPRRTKR